VTAQALHRILARRRYAESFPPASHHARRPDWSQIAARAFFVLMLAYLAWEFGNAFLEAAS